jgi:hypothetical protein
MRHSSSSASSSLFSPSLKKKKNFTNSILKYKKIKKSQPGQHREEFGGQVHFLVSDYEAGPA